MGIAILNVVLLKQKPILALISLLIKLNKKSKKWDFCEWKVKNISFMMEMSSTLNSMSKLVTSINQHKLAQFIENEWSKRWDVIDWSYSEQSEMESFSYLQKWVKAGFAGNLKYLQDERLKLRKNIKNIFPQYKSALIFLFSTKKEKKICETQKEKKIASFAL